MRKKVMLAYLAIGLVYAFSKINGSQTATTRDFIFYAAAWPLTLLQSGR